MVRNLSQWIYSVLQFCIKKQENLTLLLFLFFLLVPPSPPTRPDVYFVSANAMSIRWEEPYHDGGSKVVGYWIEKKERNTILWVKENKVPCFECNYKVTGLVEGLEYQFRTYALNAAGISKASEASRPVVAQNPVGKYNI